MTVHWLYIPFLFALGACIGSFLNVVVWRVPRGESLVHPPSRCPKCETRLSWRDNVPVIGWILLGGKCRYCRERISPRYPIVEAITGGLFVFYYVMFFMLNIGPCPVIKPGVGLEGILHPNRLLDIHLDWPVFALDMLLVASLLAASLIDAEHFIIPLEIPWLCAAAGFVVHAIFDEPVRPGALNVNAAAGALAAGSTVGLAISIALLKLKVFPVSFPDGELMEIDKEQIEAEFAQSKRDGNDPGPTPKFYSRREIRLEMRKEMLFLLPPMLLSLAWWFATTHITSLQGSWDHAMRSHWLSGLLGSLLGAMIGGLVVWFFRIFGTLFFGRVAMGLGDVHLMFGVGAIVGSGAVTIAFFLAPFFGIVLAVYMLLTGKRRELPYGPYLSLGTALVLLFYCPIAAYLTPGLEGLVFIIRDIVGQTPPGA